MTESNPEIQRLLDYVSGAALTQCKARVCLLAVVDRYGKSIQSTQAANGAKIERDRIDELFKLARKSEEPIERCRGDRYMTALPFRIRSAFHGMLYLEGIGKLDASQIELARHLIDFTSISIENAFLRDKLLTDQLTGLFNSNYVKNTLEREIRMARGLDKKLALLLIDIDNFSSINNHHGTSTGDAVLIETGERLAEELKSILGVTAHRVNVWLEGAIGRYGGDEFAFLLFDASQNIAGEIAQRILTNFQQKPIMLSGTNTSIPISVSIGGAIFPDDAGNAEKLFVKAYHALYTAKVNGKNQYWLCSQSPDHSEAVVTGLNPRGQAAVTVIMKTITEDISLDQILARTLSQLMKETRADRGRLTLLEEPPITVNVGWADEPVAVTRAMTSTTIRVPLEAGRTIGVIELSSAAGTFNDEDFALMKALAARAGTALDRTRRLQQATTKLKKMEETLRRGLRELSERYTFGNIIGRSKPMMDVFALMEKVCSVDYPVIVEGETGTGKELVAKSIHFNSRRKDRPFIPINCAAISETILESELFGHVKGAFTGADEYKAGLFELANGGTLFLDEIEEMSPTLQRKLLRVLEDRNVRPVGAKDVISVDVRVIASTNQSVKELLAKEKLREDLYYRLATFTIYLPPLRERAEDIPLICEHLLNEISREVNGPKKTLDPDALGVLMRHPWPGNIRELRNELRKAYVLSPTDRLSPAHFSPHVNPSELTPAYEGDYARAIQQFERSMILQALEHHKGNLTHAAQALGLARNTLKAKMKQYGIRAVPNV